MRFGRTILEFILAAGAQATTAAGNLRMLDSIATMRHLFWLFFLAPFPLPERARMSGRYR
jgi:hypothetical protein